MALTIDEKKAIIAYRIEKSRKTMIEARDNAKMKHWSLAANCLYYALFQIASALLVDKGYTSKTHSGYCVFLDKNLWLKVCWGKNTDR